jgi:hypothetical protein
MISPFGISDFCGTVAGMVTPKGSISTEGETLLVSVLLHRCSICPPLHRHNWLSFGKFQDTERSLIPCPRHVSSRLLSSGETCKYATGPSILKNWGSLPIDMLLSAVSVLVVVQPGSEVPEALMNYPICNTFIMLRIFSLTPHNIQRCKYTCSTGVLISP